MPVLRVCIVYSLHRPEGSIHRGHSGGGGCCWACLHIIITQPGGGLSVSTH